MNVCRWFANTNTSNATEMMLLVTVQRQCCVCWGAWKRWATWVSVLCSPVMAAWPPGGRAHHEETTRVALCTPPASRGPPPSPWLHRLSRGARRWKRKADMPTWTEAQPQEALTVCWCCSRSIHTSTLKNVAASPFQPSHVFEAQEGGVHTEARAALPHAVDVTWTHLRHQRHCEEDSGSILDARHKWGKETEATKQGMRERKGKEKLIYTGKWNVSLDNFYRSLQSASTNH